MWEVDADLWWRDLETHLRGAFLCARSVLPSMISHRQGRIITMGSRAGLQPVAYWSTYAIAKSALMRFTENLAIETIDHNISVFTLNPGVVRTAMAEYVLVAGEAWTPWYRRYFDEGRDAPPEHIAELCVFLASGKGDALSGRFVSVSDNITEMVQRAEEIKKNNLYTLRLHRL